MLSLCKSLMSGDSGVSRCRAEAGRWLSRTGFLFGDLNESLAAKPKP